MTSGDGFIAKYREDGRVAYDPWRFGAEAIKLEREGVRAVAFSQSDSRMIPASQRLHAAITERRLTLPRDRELAAHAAAAIARHSRRGWRIDKASRSDHVDAIVALAMCLDRAEFKPEPARVLGWL